MSKVTETLLLVASILTALGTIWATIFKIVKPIQKLVERSNDNEKSNLMLMKYHIKEMCNRSLKRGYLWSEELDDINEMYESYVKKGGNGSAKSRVERCRNLPIKHHDEPWETERIR